MGLLSLLLTIAIVGAVLWIIYWAISQIPMPPPFMIVVRVIFAIVVAILAIEFLTGGGLELGGAGLLHGRCL
jgi:hypothetical protein